jgi:uncharacterized pyridoxal phosphate-dependent enzyme
MDFRLPFHRRSFLHGAGAALGTIVSWTRLLASPGRLGESASVPSRPVKIRGFGETGNVYKELGVSTVINGQGTMTMLGGSLMPLEVEQVMAVAARSFVDIPDLEVAAGKRIAQLLKLPEGYTGLVTSGAAGAMTCGYAGILTGDNDELIQRVPDLTGMKSEVIIQKAHRYGFDHAIRATGVKLIEVETIEDLKRAVSPRTAMMHFTNLKNAEGQIKVEEWVRLAREYHLPCFNDAAADTPPVSHLWDYVKMGYDMVAFSGGKAMRGPQCAGLLLGREEMIRYAMLNNSPFEDTVGRGQKVGKEEIVGMVKALELYLNQDHQALSAMWQRRLDTINSRVAKLSGVDTRFYLPEIANHVPTMQVHWDPGKIRLTPEQAHEVLKNSNPSIRLGTTDNGLEITSFMLQPGEDVIIAEALVKMFRDHRA